MGRAAGCGAHPRHLEPADDYVVEEILQTVKADDYGLQTLVLAVIGSDIFRSR